MDASFPGYSAAQALRVGGASTVRDALLAARTRTLAHADAYAQALAPAGMRIPYDTALNPPLWELGHIAWFQEYWIARNRQRTAGVLCDPDHERAPPLLAPADSWYDSSRVAHRLRWELDLPSAQGVRDYLAQTLEQTLELLDKLPSVAGDADLYFYKLVALHEEMHAEASTYMARTLGITLPAPASTPRGASQAQLDVPAQVFPLGYEGTGFAFDNELGAHPVTLDPFRIDAAPVTWSRFMPFVESGAYAQQPWWSPEGWQWLQAHSADPDPAGAPGNAAVVHVSAHQAEAWCRWAGRRLPTEAEWECAALTTPGFVWGDVWEWTSSAFEPYPGFAPHPYRDYSAPWFGSRRVLRGACHATAASLAHPRYRNFFEPRRNDVFAGFRSCAIGKLAKMDVIPAKAGIQGVRLLTPGAWPT